MTTIGWLSCALVFSVVFARAFCYFGTSRNTDATAESSTSKRDTP